MKVESVDPDAFFKLQVAKQRRTRLRNYPDGHLSIRHQSQQKERNICSETKENEYFK